MAIIVDIDICLSGLKHRDKFKHIISRFKYTCGPVQFKISHDLRIPYYNFGASCWYNKVKIKWEHILILDEDNNLCKEYQY